MENFHRDIRAFSLTGPTFVKVLELKKLEKRVQLPQDLFGTPACRLIVLKH